MRFDDYEFVSMYNRFEDINLESYLNKFGIIDIPLFVSAKTIEDNSHYENIIEFAKRFTTLVKEKGIKKIYILLDSDVDGYMSGSIIYLFIKEYASDIHNRLGSLFLKKSITSSSSNPCAFGLFSLWWITMTSISGAYSLINK